MIAKASKPPALKKRLLSLKQKRLHNFSLGKRGEELAATWLQQHGFQVVDHNVRFKNQEVDLVALDLNYQELVFIEVKTRGDEDRGSPTRAVNRRKIGSMQAVAGQYLRQRQLSLDYRFDIITVVSGTIQHYQNVTWGSRR